MVIIVLIPLLPCAISRILCGILQLSQLVICIFPVFSSIQVCFLDNIVPLIICISISRQLRATSFAVVSYVSGSVVVVPASLPAR